MNRAGITVVSVFLILLGGGWLSGCRDTSLTVVDVEVNYTGVIEAIRNEIPLIMEQNQITGLALSFVDGDEFVWSDGMGYTDKESGIQADGNSAFEIGSVSKTMTAIAVMQQIEQGRLHLEDTLSEVLPGFSIQPALRFPDSGAEITLHSMLTHLSGLPGDLLNGAFAREFYPAFNQNLMDWLQSDHLAYPPGTYFSYSNTATSLLSSVVEQVSGQSFEQLTQSFFTTIGMDNSSFFRLPQTYGPGYVAEEPLDSFVVNIAAAGSVVSTANDMAKYMRAMLNRGEGERGRFLNADTIDQMWTLQTEEALLDVGVEVGLIWILNDPAFEYAGRSVWHNGSTILYNSHLVMLPDLDLGVFVVSNSATGGGGVRDIAVALMQKLIEAKTGQVPPLEEEEPSYLWVEKTQDELQRYEGYYALNSHGIAYVQAHEGYLTYTVDPWEQDADELTLFPADNSLFYESATSQNGYGFASEGVRDLLIIEQAGRRSVLGEKYSPVLPVPDGTGFEGVWQAVDLDPQDFGNFIDPPYVPMLEIFSYDAIWVMKFDDEPLLLVPVDETTAVTWGVGRNLGAAVKRVSREEGEQIRFLSYHFGK